jgi:hypothetical protein
MRRYEPDVKTEYYGYGDEATFAEMVECKDGEWVPYENANNEIKRLLKRISKLEKSLELLQPKV